MLKNEFDKELTKSNNNNNNNNNLNEQGSPSSFKKKRRDGKGNTISKKEVPIKKSKHHAYLIDNLIPGQNIANIVNIESYKKYNVDSEEEDEEAPESQKEEKIEDTNVITKTGCCLIF